MFVGDIFFLILSFAFDDPRRNAAAAGHWHQCTFSAGVYCKLATIRKTSSLVRPMLEPSPRVAMLEFQVRDGVMQGHNQSRMRNNKRKCGLQYKKDGEKFVADAAKKSSLKQPNQPAPTLTLTVASGPDHAARVCSESFAFCESSAKLLWLHIVSGPRSSVRILQHL
jgi:hypothetical protein